VKQIKAPGSFTPAVGDTYFLTHFLPDINFKNTLQRIHGQMTLTSSSDAVQGVLSAIVLPEMSLNKTDGNGYAAFDKVQPSFPTPCNNEGTDDWPLWQPVWLVSNQSTLSSTMWDSKAKRRIGKDEVLILVLEVLQVIGTSHNYTGVIRILRKLLT